MKKVKGFTLIELLIVVAIIAILAAIAVPNFLEAQVRSKVSRAKSDMRTLATGIEAYMVDTNGYPGSNDNSGTDKNVNAGIDAANEAYNRSTFLSTPASTVLSLTTPVAFITSVPLDPFADTRECAFGYANFWNAGWLVWSYGPDTDEKDDNGDIQAALDASYGDLSANVDDSIASPDPETIIYHPGLSNPTEALLVGDGSTCATYDPTNGTTSEGDVWRVRQ